MYKLKTISDILSFRKQSEGTERNNLLTGRLQIPLSRLLVPFLFFVFKCSDHSKVIRALLTPFLGQSLIEETTNGQ